MSVDISMYTHRKVIEMLRGCRLCVSIFRSALVHMHSFSDVSLNTHVCSNTHERAHVMSALIVEIRVSLPHRTAQCCRRLGAVACGHQATHLAEATMGAIFPAQDCCIMTNGTVS